MQQRIERVDDIPLLLEWLNRMGIREQIDSHWNPHGNRDGLTYGQSAQLFITYVLHCTHSTIASIKWSSGSAIIRG